MATDSTSATETGSRTRRPKIVIVMPAYNAALTLEKTYYALPEGSYDQIILVDDASSDNTLEIASKLKIVAIRHRKNRGYGGNQKTCYARALEEGAEIVVMLHPDYQYDPTIAKDIVEPILRGEADVVLASRMLGDPLRGGMPLYKFVANKFLTWMENVVLGTRFSEFHTGYRAYNRHALESVNFEANSENFVFDNEILVQFVLKNMQFKEIPVSTRYSFDSSSVSFKAGVVYGLSILRTVLKYLLFKWGIVKYKQFN
ncbi:MAG: glycosyltransferase family 2 protein [Acidobacteria bacterium]|nr:glycosyltransferase family 2 protein [Acidobacteriota bacterium]MCI0621964.1 glycosyltransferase family 2 protein [Acidobacteriota bacterium]MCI0721158.1 glycosyltransferase family 2 protein [Acidobacteriota bacterium]